MSNEPHPFGREPRNEGEWRVLIDWRLSQLEAKINSLTKAVVTMLIGIIVGVIVYFLTQKGGGSP